MTTMTKTRDVPRNAHGWPTVEPRFFTLPQLIREARSWSSWDERGTVEHAQWEKYTSELLTRGFSTATEIQERLLPDEVQRRERPLWWSQMSEE